MLNYVRERGPISRAEIAQETALQRSTTSIIVEELKVLKASESASGAWSIQKQEELLSCPVSSGVTGPLLKK